VALLFGPGAGATAASTDQLGRPWWAEYAPAVEGSWRDAGGEEKGNLPEEVFARLTDDNRVEFLQNISLKEESEATFQLKPRQPVTVGRWTFPAGSRLTFRQPSLTDMLDRMGGDVAGRRFARGRVVKLPGVSDAERIFTLASLVAVLSGGVIEPDLKPALETGRGFLESSGPNPTPNASAVARRTELGA